MRTNLLLNSDSYKSSMHLQYAPGTETIYSYIEARNSDLSNEVVFFGLQAFIKEYLQTPINMYDVAEAEELWTAHGEPFNREMWEHIVLKYDGYMPVRIRGLSEGIIVPLSTVMLTIENTDPKCFDLTTYLETALLRAIWYPSSVATNSREMKKIILNHLKESGDESTIGFKLHDFGARGCSSYETSALGGMAHLVNFMGTDTIAGVVAARKYYHEPMAGYSIPAAEHSTITSWGQENEVDSYRNMLKQFAKPGSLVAIVSDSYDIYNAVKNIWGKELRQEVIDSGATVIIRPDSGNPTEVVLKCVELLDEAFGSVLNAKGYKVLNYVRVIQGDGITEAMIDDILSILECEGYSSDNIAFGMGGTLLQAPMRDDYGWAMKCSAAKINGKWVDVFKNPVTDSFKKSKKGRFAVVEQHGIGSSTLRTISEKELTGDPRLVNMLETVYENGRLVKETTFAEVRSRASL